MNSLWQIIRSSGLTDLEFLQGLNSLSGQKFQDKVEPLLEEILGYQNSNDKEIAKLCREIALKIDPRSLAKHLKFFIGNNSELCKKLAMKIPKRDLIPYFKYLVDRHINSGYDSRLDLEGNDSTLYRDLALMIPTKYIEERFKWLLDKQSEKANKWYIHGDTLYGELLLKVGEKVIIANFYYILDIASKCGPIISSDTENIIIELLSKISQDKLTKYLKYFVKNLVHREYQTINWLDGPKKDRTSLITSINFKSVWFDQFVCKQLAMKIGSKDLAKELKYLIACQKAQSIHQKFKHLSNLCEELALKIDEKDLIGYLEYLIDCQKSEDQNIIKLCEKLAMKISKGLLKSKRDVILRNLSSENEQVRKLCEKLALKIEDPERMKKIFQKVLNALDQ